MGSAGRQKTKAKRTPARSKRARPAAAKKPVRPVSRKRAAPANKPAEAAAKPSSPKTTKTPVKSKDPEPELQVPLPDGRRHVLSLSFVRDGDEFLARLETDSGHITEFKNRSLDQLLTLVAGELEDLVE
ncbi:MAG TPA: hypothetical protein VJ021_00655 [Thermoplasmata archaeon]|nr:hypothetical protein [Thermoplasmata archaeon]